MKVEQLNCRSDENTKNFFDSTYNRLYKDLMKIELKEQLDFIKRSYIKNDQIILDLCCGTGRHMIPLNFKGYDVYGVDINKDDIESINKRLKEENYEQKAFYGDAKSFDGNSLNYDFIYSMESSIGYLPDIETIEILKNTRKLLKEDGKFLLHLINKEYAVKNLTKRMWFEVPNEGYLLEDRNLNVEQGTIELKQIRIIDKKRYNYNINLRLYSLQEMKLLMQMSGLTITDVYGDFEGNNFSISTPYMIIEAQRSKI
ncbi:MAG: class I SAM-dependent methyltransferase [Lactobacillaceae bacterium]